MSGNEASQTFKRFASARLRSFSVLYLALPIAPMLRKDLVGSGYLFPKIVRSKNLIAYPLDDSALKQSAGYIA
jgi:hypothetical protein